MFKPKWSLVAAIVAVMAVVLIGAPIAAPDQRGTVYLIVLGLMIGALAVTGWAVNGRFAGVIIDNRNRMSLSKLQAAAWTCVVLAGFASAAAFNAHAPAAGFAPVSVMSVQIPGELLLAMGLSATSLVATPALLSLKAQETPDPKGVRAAAAKGFGANGKVLVKDDPGQASVADLVTGEEVGNASAPDLGKIQQAAITLVLLGCYAAYVYGLLAGPTSIITSLPVLDKSFVWLLGISHASYLAYKAAPHTQSGASS
jgi:hypothetical protein